MGLFTLKMGFGANLSHFPFKLNASVIVDACWDLLFCQQRDSDNQVMHICWQCPLGAGMESSFAGRLINRLVKRK